MPEDLVDEMSPLSRPGGDGTGDGDVPVRLPRLGVVGWARWAWRQLTSMRVALMLLVLLAVVAIPGSVLPQRPQNPSAVARYLEENPDLGPWLDRLGLFDVFASVWFSAVYLLLFASLIGCIVPRVAVHVRAARSRPPRAPRRFERFAVRDEVVVAAPAEDVLVAARAALVGSVPRLPRFRVVSLETGTLSAERGYLRETGNILFHLALVGLLVSVAVGQLFQYRGQAIVVEGRGFANAVTDYDTFVAGSGFDPGSLVPFTLTLDRFQAVFDADTRPRDFSADVTVREPAGSGLGEERSETIRLNDPLEVGGAKVYLQGNGYAPEVTVRDAAGEVAFAGAVPFLPEDAVYTSRGVIKVPDVSTGDQIGLVGYLLPTAVVTDAGAASVHPDPGAPLLVLSVWRGDLGLDTGVPQNVYELDVARMEQVTGDGGMPVTVFVEPGQTVELPDGLGTITWDGLPRFAALDLRHDPALGAVLASAIAALVGLAVSLFTPRRRIWVRATDHGGRTVVALAALARGDDLGLPGELARVTDAVRALGEVPDDAGAGAGAGAGQAGHGDVRPDDDGGTDEHR